MILLRYKKYIEILNISQNDKMKFSLEIKNIEYIMKYWAITFYN